MKKTNKRKQKGFTLIEMVVSMLTVTIVTGLFLVLVNMVKNTYEEMEMNSDGQILVSTLTNYVQDELRFATAVDPDPEDKITDQEIKSKFEETYTNLDTGDLKYFTYYSGNLQASDQCQLKGVTTTNKDGVTKEIVCITFDRTLDGNTTNVKYPLVGNSSYIFDLNATIDAVYHTKENKFYVIIDVYRSKNDKKISIIKSVFTVEPLNRNHRLYTTY